MAVLLTTSNSSSDSSLSILISRINADKKPFFSSLDFILRKIPNSKHCQLLINRVFEDIITLQSGNLNQCKKYHNHAIAQNQTMMLICLMTISRQPTSELSSFFLTDTLWMKKKCCKKYKKGKAKACKSCPKRATCAVALSLLN